MRFIWTTAFFCVALLVSPANAQKFNDLFGVDKEKSTFQVGGAKEVEVSATLRKDKKAGVVIFELKFTVPKEMNSYSQAKDNGYPTVIKLSGVEGWTALDKSFKPNPKPKRSFDKVFNKDVEKLVGTTTFTRRYLAPEGKDIKAAKFTGSIKYLLCDKGSCTPKTNKFTATLTAAKKTEANTNAVSEVSPLPEPPDKEAVVETVTDSTTIDKEATTDGPSEFTYGYAITPQRKVGGELSADPIQIQFEMGPVDAKVGDIVTVAITMTIDDNWSTYGIEKADETQPERPTKITFQATNLIPVGEVISAPPPTLREVDLGDSKIRSNAHEQRITWLQRFKVESADAYGMKGVINYQICENHTRCLAPKRISFSLGADQQQDQIAGAVAVSETFLSPSDKLLAGTVPVQSVAQNQEHSSSTMFQSTTLGIVLSCVVFVMGLVLLGVFELPVSGTIATLLKSIRIAPFLGFVLMGTVIWMMFSIPSDARIPTLILFLAIGLLAWMMHNLTDSTKSFRAQWKISLISLAVTVPIFGFGIKMLSHDTKVAWEPFSESRMVELHQEGVPMLIDFTADWCAVCKVNEAFALDTDEVAHIVEENGIVPMVADFTMENPEIQKLLKHFGQDSVPLTVIVPPGADSEVILLRGRVTKADLLSKLDEAITGTSSASGSGTPEEATVSTVWGAIGLAFLTGLIMNVMPCVLPVLAIKVLSLVQQAGESRARIIGLNFAYTAGVLAVFFAFAIMAWGLGQSLATVFQSTAFWIVMSCVVFTMGLSLFGVFELPVPGIIPSANDHQEGLFGAFNTGIIATLLGIPCIGPFVVPFFTWTLKQPAPVVFLVFGMMGIGMAFPYLMTGVFPALVNWLPRPGMWMVRFKQFTGFVLMGTVIWLMFSIPPDARIPTLILFLAIGLLVWMLHNLTDPTKSASKQWKTYIASFGVAVPIFFFGIGLML